MDKCQRQRLTLNTMHGLLSVGIGLATGVGAYFASSHFGYDLPAGREVFAGVVMTVIAWFASRSKFQFTEECMHMARGAEVRQVAPVKLGKRMPARSLTAPSTSAPAALPVGKLFERGRVTIAIEAGENGAKRVVITARGLSGNEFKGNNGVRPRLENISGISWENPKNEQGIRSITGTVTTSVKEAEMAFKLVQIGEKFA